MTVIRGSQAAPDGAPGRADVPDPLQERAAEVFADHLANHSQFASDWAICSPSR
jgi:hypothetical protein